jgi:hypothetical protein
MIPKLSDDQRQAPNEHGEAPVYVVDPDTNAGYVLIPVERYERIELIADTDDTEAMYPLLADIEPDDWEDVSS